MSLFRGSRGVDAIMKGAFQRVSAHLAVDAVGGENVALPTALNLTAYQNSQHECLLCSYVKVASGN